MTRARLPIWITSLFSILVLLPTAARAEERAVLFQNVTLIDMKSDRAQPNMMVIVRGDRIDGVGKQLTAPDGSRLIDGTGKFLIPGLWDNYTFALDAAAKKLPFFELLIAHGVTGVRDVGTSMDLREVANLRDDINAGRVLAPRLFYAGPVLIGEMPPRPSTRWTGNSVVVRSAEEAAKTVESLARAGVDHIKTEKRIAPEVLTEIIKEAHRHHLPVIAAPPSFIIDAANDGLDAIEHAAEIFRETSDKRNEYYALYRDRRIDTMTTDENYAFFGTMETDLPYYEKTLGAMARR